MHAKVLCTVLASLALVYGDNIQMSFNDLDLVLKTELKVIENLEDFIAKEKTKSENHNKIQKYIEDFKKLSANIAEEGFDDPIHAYLLMKHMTVDFEEVNRYVTSNQTKEMLKNLTASVENGYPTGKDIEAAALALVRLQHVYDVPVKSVLDGRIGSTKSLWNNSLGAADCFRFGSQAVLMMNLQFASDWFEQGLSRTKPSEKNGQTVKAVTSQYEAIKNILSYGNVFEGLVSQAVRGAPSYLLELSNFIPGLPPNFFQKMKAIVPSEGHEKYEKEYKQLCQGKNILEPEEEKRLICAYVRGNHAKFLLSPNKVEILSYDPAIVIYHNIMTDKEMHHLKTKSKNNLKVPRTKSSYDLTEQVTFARTGKMAFLSEDEDDELTSLSDRISDVTGLNVDYAENWQVVNYGIGGHYEVHCDFYSFDLRNMTSPGGDRLATMLFYLNDVKAGGHTVFPALKIGFKPQKGSALFWYNLKKNGHGEVLTMHAACPILAGTKWISNKWLHAYGNEFTRPCSLYSDE